MYYIVCWVNVCKHSIASFCAVCVFVLKFRVAIYQWHLPWCLMIAGDHRYIQSRLSFPRPFFISISAFFKLQSTLDIVNTICSSILFTISRGSLYWETNFNNFMWKVKISVLQKMFTISRCSLYQVFTISRVDCTGCERKFEFFSLLSSSGSKMAFLPLPGALSKSVPLSILFLTLYTMLGPGPTGLLWQYYGLQSHVEKWLNLESFVTLLRHYSRYSQNLKKSKTAEYQSYNLYLGKK